MSSAESAKPLLPILLVFLVLIGVMWWAFDGYLEKREHPNSDLATRATADSVLLQRSRDGHYRAPGTINGQAVSFFVDTGASSVAVSARLATKLGLARGHRITVQTAAGPHTAYTTRLDRVTLGSIAVDNVRGAIVPGMDDDQVLLGMSFLRHLDMQFRGETLSLQ